MLTRDSALDAGALACVKDVGYDNGDGGKGDEDVEGGDDTALRAVRPTEDLWDEECAVGCDRRRESRDERGVHGAVKNERDHAERCRIDEPRREEEDEERAEEEREVVRLNAEHGDDAGDETEPPALTSEESANLDRESFWDTF